MLGKTAWRLLALFILAAAFPLSYLAAQSQNAPSVAEAARRARQKKDSAAKAKQVITNDTIPSGSNTANGTVSQESPTPDANAPAAAPAASNEANPTDDPEEEARKKADIEALRKEIADKQQSVDLLRRQIALEQDNLYSKPDYQRDTTGKQKIEDLQSSLRAAQDELAHLKVKLAGLAGAAKQPAPANPPGSPAPPQP